MPQAPDRAAAGARDPAPQVLAEALALAEALVLAEARALA